MSSSERLLFFEQVMDQLRGDIAVFDLQHRYVYVNQYAIRDPEMRKWIIGKNDVEYCAFRGINQELAGHRRHHFAEALRTGALQEWEEHVLDKAGNPRAFIRRIFVVNDASGTPEFLVGHGIEITERWIADRELRTSSDLLNSVLQAVPGPVAVKDNQGRFLIANNAMLGLYKVSLEELIGKSQSEFHQYAGEAERFVELESKLIRSGDRDRREEQFTDAMGVVRWFETTRIPFQNSLGDTQLLLFSTDITERREKEFLLMDSERKLNEAQELSKTGSYELVFPNGNIKWSNGMYLIWELDSSVQPTLELFYSQMHPDDIERVVKRQGEMRVGEAPFSIVYRIIVPSGKIKYVEASSKIEPADHPGGMKVIGTCQDVTERILLENELRASEQRLIEAQEIARSGSWEVRFSPQLEIIWSTALFKICERELDEGQPTPESFYAQVSEQDRSRLEKVINDLVDNGIPGEVKYGFRTWAGNDRVFFSRGLVNRDADGNPISVYGTTTDITIEHLTEQRLRSSENQLLMAQEIARVGSFIFDLSTRRAEWSPGMYRIWEFDPELDAPDFETIASVYHPDDLPQMMNLFLNPVVSPEEKSLDIRIIMPDRRIKHLEIRYKWIIQDGVSQNKVFGTAMDVTEKKESESELLRARRQAEDSVKAKENFLASISHELRTPLNGILGMLRLMQKTNLSSIQREYVDVLNHTSGNLLTIINDILDFAKLESGGYLLEETVFDPAMIADTAFQLQLVKAEEKGLVMRHLHEHSEPIPRVIGDPNRLSQILLNLLNNAVKFTNRGEVLLTHRVSSTEGDSVVLSFSVRDTGIGIPAEMLERIFESFTQVHASGFGGGGVGLGLTITKGLVERLGGTIRVGSTTDVGSVFTVEIPYRKASRESLTPESGPITAGLGELRVLVVEDNKVNLYITESMLQAWGLQVEVALNGEDAVRMADENSYDLILMDVQMPVMDGLEATRLIRKFRNRARASVPVIAVTANTSRLAHKNLIREGMNDCLVKPFREEQLFRKILANIHKDNLPSGTLSKRKFPQRKTPGVKGKSLYDLSLLMRDDPGNDAFLQRMLSIFIETIPASVASMEEFHENGDWDMVSSLAHKIKPTLDGTGIISVRETIRNIESFSEKKRSPAQLGEDISTLRKIIDEVVRSFAKEIERIQS